MQRSWTVGLKTLTLYVVTAEVTELNKRKILKKAVCLPEDNHETRIVEREVKKITGLNTNWKLLFFEFFYAQRKIGEVAIPGDFKRRCNREAHTILACCFTNSLVSRVCTRHFFQFWLIFPNRNYPSRSIECHFFVSTPGQSPPPRHTGPRSPWIISSTANAEKVKSWKISQITLRS